MKIIEVPEELRVRARQVLYMEPAIQNIIRSLTQEIVKNHFEVTTLWNDVKIEMDKQGIMQEEDEITSFDHVTEKFMVIRRDVSRDIVPRR